MATYEHTQTQLSEEDRELIDLVAGALVDPKLQADARMRLHDDIAEIVRDAYQDVNRRAVAAGARPAGETRKPPPSTNADGVRDLLAEVLVDPNLHTDTRLRLYDEISNSLREAKVFG